MTHSASPRRPALLALGTAVPPFCADQEAIGEWMAASFSEQPAVKRLLRSLYAYSGIETRYGCTREFLEPPATSRLAPGRALEETWTTAERLTIYEREAPPLGTAAARAAVKAYAERTDQAEETLLDAVTHLVVVSCTGFFAPGLDFVIAQELGLASTVGRTTVGFMGCCAAFNGLRTASQIVAGDPDACVLVVAVELCSLHIQPGTRRDDLVSASLFADGAAAALVGLPAKGDGGYFRIDGFRTDMKPNTADQMAWRIGNHGFTLRLSPRIPDHLADVVPAALDALTAGRPPQFWAIHPGGRAIVDALQTLFALTDDQVAATRGILRRYGNLSSATILFVLTATAELLAAAHDNATGIAMAFGPGLTVEMAELTYIAAPVDRESLGETEGADMLAEAPSPA